MNRLVLLLIIIIPFYQIKAQDYRAEFNKGIEALQSGNSVQYLVSMQKANKLRANHQTILYHLAKAYALNNFTDSSCYYLSQVVEIDTKNYDFNEAAFDGLKEASCYQKLLGRKLFLEQSYFKADTATVINDSSMHVEGIAYSNILNRFLISSINMRNIFMLNRKGEAIKVLEDSLDISPTGLQFDQDEFLWLTAMGIKEGGLKDHDVWLNRSLLLKIDVEKGEILKRYEVKDDQQHLFGDLVITDKGDIFISDSQSNTIFSLQNEELVPLLNCKECYSLQGITYLKDDFLLFSDYVSGLYSYNLNQSKLQKISSDLSLSLKGIDGLYFDGVHLYCIQNGTHPFKIIKMLPDEKLERILSYEILEKNHPAFGEPTLGLLHNSSLYFVANSFWAINKEGQLNNTQGIKPMIMAVDLNNKSADNSIVVLERIEVLNELRDEALFFYRNNWAAFRDYAKKNRLIASYSIREVASRKDELILETIYQDSSQLISIEKHFDAWRKLNSGGAILLNEYKPTEFRKSMGVETQYAIASEPSPKISKACLDANYRDFDFWLGDWMVYDSAGNLIGKNKISRIEGGCAIREKWIAAAGEYTGSSYNYYHAQDKKWHQLWVDNQGSSLNLAGELSDGIMLLKSEVRVDGSVNRISWEKVNEDTVIQKWEVSRDRGKNWQRVFYGIYRLD